MADKTRCVLICRLKLNRILGPLSNYRFGMSHRNCVDVFIQRPALRQIRICLILFVLLIGTTIVTISRH